MNCCIIRSPLVVVPLTWQFFKFSSYVILPLYFVATSEVNVKRCRIISPIFIPLWPWSVSSMPFTTTSFWCSDTIHTLEFTFFHFQTSVALAGSVGWQGGVQAQTCGHSVHLSCHEAYVRSLRNDAQHLLTLEKGKLSYGNLIAWLHTVSVSEFSFLCPYVTFWNKFISEQRLF